MSKWDNMNTWPLWAKILGIIIAIPVMIIFMMITTPDVFDGIIK